MIFELLLLVFIIWLVFAMVLVDQNSICGQLLNELNMVATDIHREWQREIVTNHRLRSLGLTNYNFHYRLLYSTNGTYTILEDGMEPTIMIQLERPDGSPYPMETLIIALIHELAHVISPSTEHDHPFDLIEGVLSDISYRLGYLNTDSTLDEMYPCVDSSRTYG